MPHARLSASAARGKRSPPPSTRCCASTSINATINATPGRPEGHVTVQPSAIEGLGLFAARAFAPRERIWHIDESRVIDREHPLRPEAGEYEHYIHWYLGRAILLPVPERHLNHSCDPSAFYIWDGDDCYVHARRALTPGDEVTIDYAINNPGGDGSPWPCTCGVSRCRGALRGGFFELPPEIQREYLPLLASWFTEAFATRIAALRRQTGR